MWGCRFWGGGGKGRDKRCERGGEAEVETVALGMFRGDETAGGVEETRSGEGPRG
jgi:hypothetical protein